MRKKHFLIVLSLLFIFSCTREYSTEANNRIEDNTNAWVGKVNFQEMENFIQKNTKKQIPNYLKLHNLGKRTEQYITDIDTTDIIKVVHDSITSFTIKVNTLSDKDFTFSNLVINVKNNKIEEYIYHYKPEAQWLRAYIAGEENNYEGVLKTTDIDGNDTRKTYSRQASTPTTCMVYIHVPCYGSGCPCTDYNGVTYYMAATCGGGGGDGNSGDYPSGELSGGGGGGTVPSVPTSEQINSFIAFLSPSIHAYITQNTNTLTDINNYFIQNGLSPKHQSFITSILEYVERKDIAWFTFSSTFNSAVAYKKQYPDNWIKISTIQDFAFDFMLQNPNTSWEQFQNWFSLNKSIDADLVNELKNIDSNKFAEYIQINKDLDSFDLYLQDPSYNPLDSPWLKKAREYAQKLEDWSKYLGPKAKAKAREMIDKSFIYALNKTAKELFGNVENLSETQKQSYFQTDGKKGVAILLYEFANGLGKDRRDFSFDYNITQQFLQGKVTGDIRNDFLNNLSKNGLTYNQFIKNGNMIKGGYAFSPDHTTVEDSFSKHYNANWVQFFIGGANAEYYPTNENGWIRVVIWNQTTRNSLMLHQGENYDRDGSGNNLPLSTIKQYFSFKLQIY